MRHFLKNPIYPAIASALLLFSASPGAVGFAPLVWVGLVPLLWAAKTVAPWRAARLGLLSGMVYHTGLLYWVVIVLGKYGHLPWWICLAALLLLAFYMSLYTAVFAAGLSWMLRQPGSAAHLDHRAVWGAPLIWVGLDFIRAHLLTGFPWLDLAYFLYRQPLLVQAADLAGHYGITFLIVLVNSLIFLAATRRWPGRAVLPARPRPPWRWVGLPACLVLLAALSYSVLRYRQLDSALETSAAFEVGVIQGNIAQDQKWVPDMQKKTVDTYLELSEQAAAQAEVALLVWPETALPFFPADSAQYRQLIDNLVKKTGVCLLTGAPHYERRAGPADFSYYNSSILLSPAGLPAGRYNKQHLVPFGEYIPWRRYLPLAGPLVETVGDFSPGVTVEPLTCQTAKIGVLICFESIFPDLARKWIDNGANVLVNLTNDAWYGRSSAPWQSLAMAMFRAVETRRSLIRSANTGISGLIDPAGRISGASPLFEPYFLTTRVPLQNGKTFFVLYGHDFAGLCLVLVVLWAGFIGFSKAGFNSNIKEHEHVSGT